MAVCRSGPAWMCAVLVALVATGCSKSSPTQPSGTVAAPQPQQPADSSQIPFGNQPVTLTVQNAQVTTSNGTTYTFEVATDAAFANKVQTKAGVSEGGGGQTSVKLDALAGGKDYYWHARAINGSATGAFGPMARFSLGGAATVDAPAPLGPLNGAQSSPRPAFRVANAARLGQTGPITYKFEVATDAAFGSIVVTGTNSEGINETGFIPTSDLPTGVALFWRATATDAANGISGPSSAVQSFTSVAFSQAERVAAELRIALWPGTQPPGTVGQATMGDNWQIQVLHHLPTDTFFPSPTAEDLRIFDMLDRGFDPDGAISWMRGNGYFTEAKWYPPPEKAVIGLPFTYIAARNKVVVRGTWDIVLKLE